jgi:translation initiation factor 2 alpha subunit (eIF-2alpha)
MFFLFRYNNNGIPLGLIKFHDLLVKDTVKYFEKGRQVCKGIREARKAHNKALKIAKKKKRNPVVMIGTSLTVLKGFSDEIEYIRRALKATYDNMEKALNQIEQERIKEPRTLIENARELFTKNDFKNGMELLKESKEKVGIKELLNTRAALFRGISNEVKDLKKEIEKQRKG